MSVPTDVQREVSNFADAAVEAETEGVDGEVMIEELPAFELALIQGHSENEN